ncbi:M50 family metallopeptidase [Rudaeicoccus suwonensis]|uniref:Zinc metalloprotease n=1 Tax=Rudaeicoccus suwonensis TaxID=657409 RepID=A0A561EAW9_9MICO|nr:M50 family metallopeptidase [Rudaeicoccus suwonensis]TWE12763.1 Zn-dependent protease [Rudaeicoccus suwonensis]
MATQQQDTSGAGWRMGSVMGIPVYLGRSWIVIAVVIVVTFGPQVEDRLPYLGGQAYVVAMLYALLLLLSVLAHEASHAVVGKWRGYEVRQIVADLWGGHTAYDTDDASPASSALVAVAGPLTNGVLAGVAWLLLPHVTRDVPQLLIVAFFVANAFVAIFNLLPGLPLDGGFLVDALVWRITGSRPTGLIVAGWCGRMLTALVVLGALAWTYGSGGSPDYVTIIWAVFIAGFLWFGASSSIERGKAQRLLARVTVDAVVRPVVFAPGVTLVSDLPSNIAIAVCDHDGKPWGLIPSDQRELVPVGARDHTTANSLAQTQATGWACQVSSPQADVTELVRTVQLSGEQMPNVLVFDGAGRPLGVVAVAELGDALRRAEHQAAR